MPAQPQTRLLKHRALVLLVATVFGLWLVWSTLLLPRLPPVSGLERQFQSVAVRVLCWVLPAVIYLLNQYGRHRLTVPLRLGLPPTRRHLAVAGAISLAALVAVSLDVARKVGVSPPRVWLLALHNAALEFPIPAVFEELLFRSVILSELLDLLGVRGDSRSSSDDRKLSAPDDSHSPLASVSRPPADPKAYTSMWGRIWLANVAASLVFVGLHWPWWIYTEGFGPEFFMKNGGVFLLSLVLGIVFVRGRSVWPCVFLHWGNNLLSGLAG